MEKQILNQQSKAQGKISKQQGLANFDADSEAATASNKNSKDQPSQAEPLATFRR